MKIYRFVFNHYLVNSYLLTNSANEAVIIDPACTSAPEWQRMKDKLQQEKLQLKAILITHAHADHIAGVAMAIKDFPTSKLFVHKDGETLYNDYNNYSILMGFPKQELPAITDFLTDNPYVDLLGEKIQVLFTPGHAKGSVSYYIPSEKVVFTGDVLFQQSIGRTDIGGNYEELEHSIQTKLYTLPDDTQVLPGHGDMTEIGFEKKNNTFVNL